MAPTGENLEIVFRYLMLHYSSPAGLRVLIPRKSHRTIMRDTSTDTELNLSEAFVRLEIDRKEAPSKRTLVKANGFLNRFEDVLGLPGYHIPPEAEYLERPIAGNPALRVNPALNGLFHLPDGVLEAFPSGAFPELALDLVTIEFGPVYTFRSQVTDTALYKTALPKGPLYELVVTSHGRTSRVDISDGARFEVCNVDQKVGVPLTREAYATEEFREVLELFGLEARIACDYFQCLMCYSGE